MNAQYPRGDSQPLDEASDLLANCPRCAYVLRGLPIKHRCPECGLELDRRWRVFAGERLATWTPAKQLFLGSIRWSPALFIAAWAIAVIIKEGWSPPYALLLGLQVAVIFAVVIWLTRWSWSFVALGPDGVHIFNHARKRGGTFAWSRVGYARYSVFFEIVTLAIDHKSMRLSVRRYFGGKLSEAERCTRAINRYPRPPYRLAVKPSTDASSASEQMV